MIEHDFSNFQHLCGWIDDGFLRAEAFANLPSHCQTPFNISRGIKAKTKRMMLWEVVRRICKDQNIPTDENGDIPNIPQEIGDCVSWGAKHAVEYLECCQIAMGNIAKLRLTFSPYIYGCSRVFIGGGQMGGQDGSVGVWAAQAVMKYGTLALDEQGVPGYSGNIAKQWGSSKRALDPFVKLGEEHLVKTTKKISSWDDLVDAITNLYPVTVASNVGFTMSPQNDGFHHRQSQWGHQMCIVGVDGDADDPYACVLNSWGDAMGHIIDFKDPNLKWPVGTLRVRRKDIEAMLSEDDSWAYSSFIDYPGQVLPESFFSGF